MEFRSFSVLAKVAGIEYGWTVTSPVGYSPMINKSMTDVPVFYSEGMITVPEGMFLNN